MPPLAGRTRHRQSYYRSQAAGGRDRLSWASTGRLCIRRAGRPCSAAPCQSPRPPPAGGDTAAAATLLSARRSSMSTPRVLRAARRPRPNRSSVAVADTLQTSQGCASINKRACMVGVMMKGGPAWRAASSAVTSRWHRQRRRVCHPAA